MKRVTVNVKITKPDMALFRLRVAIKLFKLAAKVAGCQIDLRVDQT
jgi:hypothetical protein